MKSISEFSRKPQLIEIVLDSPDVIQEFGDSIVFYMLDYVDIDTYFEFFRRQSESGLGLNELLRKIILKADGTPAIDSDQALPVTLAVNALTKVNDNLGKLKTTQSMNQTGNQPS